MASAATPHDDSTSSDHRTSTEMHSTESICHGSLNVHAASITTELPHAQRKDAETLHAHEENGVNGVNGEIFDLSAALALELLCANVHRLAQFAGDLTPTSLKSPAASIPGTPTRKDSDVHAVGGEAAVRLAELHFTHHDDGHHPSKRESIQQGMLTKRFLSKREPPIPLKEYLLRLHKYCPMSTAVYLAASIYITRIVSVDRILSIQPRNVHRLVLAGLRVAMKALEDLSWPHSRFAKVGGVSERELSRLEIGFCFLTDFELRVDALMLHDEARKLQAIAGLLLAESREGISTPESPRLDSGGPPMNPPCVEVAT